MSKVEKNKVAEKSAILEQDKDLIIKDLEIKNKPEESSSKKNGMSLLKKFDKFKTQGIK